MESSVNKDVPEIKSIYQTISEYKTQNKSIVGSSTDNDLEDAEILETARRTKQKNVGEGSKDLSLGIRLASIRINRILGSIPEKDENGYCTV